MNHFKYLVVCFLCVICLSCEKPDQRSYITNNYSGLTSAAGLQIGDIHQGGIVFYIDGSGQHGLVCSSYDISYSAGFLSVNAGTPPSTSLLLGTGQANTTALVNQYGSGAQAAYMCDTLNLEGYSDWFLPSADEFSAISMNLISNNIGGFNTGNSIYISSTTLGFGCYVLIVNPINAQLQSVAIGTIFSDGRVRPVRKF